MGFLPFVHHLTLRPQDLLGNVALVASPHPFCSLPKDFCLINWWNPPPPFPLPVRAVPLQLQAWQFLSSHSFHSCFSRSPWICRSWECVEGFLPSFSLWRVPRFLWNVELFTLWLRPCLSRHIYSSSPLLLQFPAPEVFAWTAWCTHCHNSCTPPPLPSFRVVSGISSLNSSPLSMPAVVLLTFD